MNGIAATCETENQKPVREDIASVPMPTQAGSVGSPALNAVEAVEQANDDHQTGVLNSEDKGVDDAG